MEAHKRQTNSNLEIQNSKLRTKKCAKSAKTMKSNREIRKSGKATSEKCCEASGTQKLESFGTGRLSCVWGAPLLSDMHPKSGTATCHPSQKRLDYRAVRMIVFPAL
jgi:hypothetical protein